VFARVVVLRWQPCCNCCCQQYQQAASAGMCATPTVCGNAGQQVIL
jgi:hypothetical protein